jgi:hypothetical protein
LKPLSHVQFGLRWFNPGLSPHWKRIWVIYYYSKKEKPLRRFNPGLSPHWKRIWVIYYYSKKEKPPRVGRLLFSTTTQIWLLI